MLYSLIFFICSYRAKEQAVILPVCLFLFDWFLKRNFRNKKLWLEKIPFFILSFCMGCFTLYLAFECSYSEEKNYIFVERMIFSSYSFFEYFFKWLVPVNLLYLYPFPYLPGEMIPYWIYPYPLLLIIVFYCFWKYLIEYWQITFGLLFFVINLLMVLQLVPLPRFFIIADRYMYLSSIGLSFIAASYIQYLLLDYSKYHFLIRGVLMAIFIYWCIYSNVRVRVWHDSDSLKKEVRSLLDQREETTLNKPR